MRTQSEIQHDINTPGLTGPTIPNADRLILELLLDIRDLLVDLRNQKPNTKFAYDPRQVQTFTTKGPIE